MSGLNEDAFERALRKIEELERVIFVLKRGEEAYEQELADLKAKLETSVREGATMRVLRNDYERSYNMAVAKLKVARSYISNDVLDAYSAAWEVKRAEIRAAAKGEPI